MLALLLLPFLLSYVLANVSPKPICPESIKKDIWNSGSHEDNDDLRKIYQNLTTCATAENSTTRTLELKIQQGGCVVGNNDWNFQFRPGDRFPSLHMLYLNGYSFTDYPKHESFYSKSDSYHYWRWLADWTGIQLFRPQPQIGQGIVRGSNLEKWKSAMDWSELTHLSLDDVDAVFLESMPREQLPALKFLQLGELHSRSCFGAGNITEYLIQSNPLTSLSLQGYTERLNLTAILDRHGESLEKLRLHEWEGNHFLRPALSRAQIEQISQKCSSLSKLSLDINRNGTWPYNLLDPLAANKNLKSLEISFELGMNLHSEPGYSSYYDEIERYNTEDAEKYQQPFVNASSSLSLFHHLRSLKQGSELQELTIVVGDAHRDYGAMLRFPSWGEQLDYVYHCAVLDSKGDRKLEGEPWCESRATRYARYEPDEILEDED